MKEFIETGFEELKPVFQYKNWKKITNLRSISLPEHKIEGVLISDKTGEIFFLNSDNLSRLPADPESVPGRWQEGADNFDFVAKLVYGHQ